MGALVSIERIESIILLIRGYRVILDHDLATLYGVTTKAFNRQVRRNQKRFPPDFVFQLTVEEFESLRCHFGTSKIWPLGPIKTGRGGRRYLPFVFTEQGIAMLSSVLNSERAIGVNIEIMRAFVRLRAIIASHKDLAHKLNELEKRYDAQFRIVFDAIRKIMEPPPKPKRRIGFELGEDNR